MSPGSIPGSCSLASLCLGVALCCEVKSFCALCWQPGEGLSVPAAGVPRAPVLQWVEILS